MNSSQIKLISKLNKLNRDIIILEENSKINSLQVGTCTLSGDTSKLIIACAINALNSQRENYKEQLRNELSGECYV